MALLIVINEQVFVSLYLIIFFFLPLFIFHVKAHLIGFSLSYKVAHGSSPSMQGHLSFGVIGINSLMRNDPIFDAQHIIFESMFTKWDKKWFSLNSVFFIS